MARKLTVTVGGQPIMEREVSDTQMAEGVEFSGSGTVASGDPHGMGIHRYDLAIEVVRLRGAPCAPIGCQAGGLIEPISWSNDMAFILSRPLIGDGMGGGIIEQFPVTEKDVDPAWYFSFQVKIFEGIAIDPALKASISIEGCAQFRRYVGGVEQLLKELNDIPVSSEGVPYWPKQADVVGKGMVLLETVEQGPYNRILRYGLPVPTHFRVDTLWSDGKKVRGETRPISELVGGYSFFYDRSLE